MNGGSQTARNNIILQTLRNTKRLDQGNYGRLTVRRDSSYGPMDKRQKLMMTGFVTMLLLLLLLMMMIMIMVTTQQAKYSGSSDVISLTNPVRS